MKTKRILAAFLFCSALIGTVSAKDLKVLMIGNSFSICVGTYLPQIVHSFPEHSLELTSAYIGGCTLDRHVRCIKAAEKDPDAGKYLISIWNSRLSDPTSAQRYYGNLIDVLKKQPYDIVTIQQGSVKSWIRESYEPYAGELISFVRKCQPDAEIVIQQTWSYRVDAPQLERFKVDQTGMYEGLRDAYRALAEKYKFRVIPTGDAIQLFRKYTPVKYQPPASDKTFEYPELPSCAGDVVGSAQWAQSKDQPGARKLTYDWIHLNKNGKYLQACLWFSFLYGEAADKIALVPEDIPQDMAVLLRRCAKEALAAYPQTAGKNEKK